MWKRVSLFLVFVLVAAACGSDDQGSEEATVTASRPTGPTQQTTDNTYLVPTDSTFPDFPASLAGVSFVIEEPPQAIVSLSPSSTEILYGIGAGSQIIAVDDQSDFPAEAPQTDLSGFQPNLEAIVSFEPDLVVIQFDPDGNLVPALENLEIPVVVQGSARRIEDAFDQMLQLGILTGHEDEALALAETMREQIEALIAQFFSPDEDRTFYFELDNTLFSASSRTLAGEVFTIFGLENIADAASGDFPQLSAEYIIDANPDIIFFGCGEFCGTTAESIASREGWDVITAVQSGAIFELDDDLTSRWGPRIVEFVELVGSTLAAAQN